MTYTNKTQPTKVTPKSFETCSKEVCVRYEKEVQD